jgi:CIC family chloride channel protein
VFRPGSAPALMVLAGVIGAGAGLGAVVLIKAIQAVGYVMASFAGIPRLHQTWILLTLPAGVWLAWRLSAWLAPEVAGHGVPQIIAAIAVRGSMIRGRVAPMKALTTALTIGAGGSAGREGSIAQIGASLGSWIARLVGLGETDIRVLVAAGAGAGIAATFNAPIAGMFFAMEVILGAFSVRHLHTVVVASVTGAVISRSILGEELTFRLVPYSLGDPAQLLLYGVLGLLAVGFAWVFLQALDWFEVVPNRLKRWLRPLVLGGLVGLLGFFRPEVLGTGQVFIGRILRGEISYIWWILGLLAVLKAIATSATLGGKGSGGIFMPSLFIGATAGAGFAQLVAPVWPTTPLEPGAFALVGMAATFAAVARAPLTSILIVFETTGDYGLVLPLMVATSISTFLAGRVRPESAYTAPLARMGIHPTQTAETDLLDTVTVGEVTTHSPLATTPEASLAEVQGHLHRHRLHGLPVVEDGKLVGIISESDIVRAGGPSDELKVAEAMTPNPVTVTPEMPVSEALERMAALGIGRLPVVNPDDPTRLVGLFRREDVVHAYHRALSASSRKQRLGDRFLTTRTDAHTRFFEFEIPPDSIAEGRRISEIPWPEGCLLVSVHRGPKLLIATGDTVLRAGDAITAFGGEEARGRLVQRLAARIETPEEEDLPVQETPTTGKGTGAGVED